MSGSTVAALLFAMSSAASAGYGSGGGGYAAGYGSSGSYAAGYGSSGGYYGGSSGGGSSGGGSSGGHVGPLRRLGARIHDRVHAKAAVRSASYGSSGGSFGGSRGYGSSGGSSGGYGPRSYGSSGGGSSGRTYYGGGASTGGSTGSYAPSYGGSTGTSLNYGSYESHSPSTPMEIEYSSIMPETSSVLLGNPIQTQALSKLESRPSIQPNEVHLTVKLPEAAEVFVNGNRTTTKGELRHFVSRDLKEQEAYRFEVKVVLKKEDGSEVVQNRTVVVNSGNGEELVFDMVNADDPVETILTLNVPENAKVVLAKNTTKSDGTSRVYRTKQLKQGEAWDDYSIEVTHNGVTKEKTLRLIGGDKLEFTFNFDATETRNKVAMK